MAAAARGAYSHAAMPNAESHEVIAGDPARGLLLIADHASNALPARYERLGLPDAEFERHIAYDIGIAAVTRGLAAALGVPAVLSSFSRLLIDPNRGLDDPTLIMQISDGAVVPGNARIDAAGRQARIDGFYRPYHAAITAALAAAEAAGRPPVILSLHSFTPFWRGVPRPWHAGFLWDPLSPPPRFTRLLMDAIRADKDLVVGENEPYSGGLQGDTLDMHGTGRGIGHALLEIRQDLIASPAGQADWCQRLAAVLPGILAKL